MLKQQVPSPADGQFFAPYIVSLELDLEGFIHDSCNNELCVCLYYS